MRGYFLCADLLGFSKLVKTASAEERIELLRTWMATVELLAKTHRIDRFRFFSDTLILATGSEPRDFCSLVSFCRELLEKSARLGLPVRGGIALGEYEWGDSVTGAAVVAAHEIESVTDWIGVTCAHGMTPPPRAFQEGLIICYAPPLKDGDVTFLSVVEWSVPSIQDIIAHMGFKKHRDKEPVSWEVARKAKNTAEFGLYSRLVKQAGLNRHECYCHPPLVAFERIAQGEAPFSRVEFEAGRRERSSSDASS